MRKLLVLLTTLLFAYASLATAENEAIYELNTGLVEVPVLSVKGQPDKYSAIFQQQDNGKLTFTLADTILDPSIDSSTNEAIYDTENGTIIIPALMISGDEDLSDNVYFVELQEIAQQQTEQSVFKVIQILDTSVQTTRALYGVSSSNATSARCSGAPDQNLDVARQNFQTKCGEPWNDQKHVCDYKPDGFHCNGNVTASATPETTSSTTSNPVASGSSRCTGNPSQNLATARENFRTMCGESWNAQKHVCDYKEADGFHCSGNVSTSTTPAPTNPIASNPPASSNLPQLSAPSSVNATRLHRKVVYIEWYSSSLYISASGYDIYRNGKKISSIPRHTSRSGYLPAHPNYGYIDEKANTVENPTYQIVAYNSHFHIRSPSSNVADPNPAANYKEAVPIDRTMTYTNAGRTISITGELTVDLQANNSIVSQTEIRDERGNNLGSMTHSYNGSTIVSEYEPAYGPSFTETTNVNSLDPQGTTLGGLVEYDFDLGIGLHAGQMVNTFPARPRQTTTTTPGGGDCENCPPTNPPPFIQDCPSGGGECVGP
jgi:hypothetical protein